MALVPKAEPVVHYQVQEEVEAAVEAPLPHQAVEAVRVEAAAQYQVPEEAAVEHLAPSP